MLPLKGGKSCLILKKVAAKPVLFPPGLKPGGRQVIMNETSFSAGGLPPRLQRAAL
jgi:hypothetical protein